MYKFQRVWGKMWAAGFKELQIYEPNKHWGLFRNTNWYLINDVNVWYPRIFIVNAVEMTNILSFEKDSHSINSLWYYYPEHKLRHSRLLIVEISCKISFQSFPFDSHQCIFYLKNWIGSIRRVILTPPILMTNDEDGNNLEADEITLPGGKYEFNFKTLPTSVFKDGGDTGSMAQVEINFKRTSASQNQVFGGYYIQTATFATLSLLSYFIKQSVVPGRMGMVITLFLIQVNTYNSVEAPPGRGFSSIDIWTFGIQIPILVAILEYGTVLSMKKFWTKEGNNERILKTWTC